MSLNNYFSCILLVLALSFICNIQARELDLISTTNYQSSWNSDPSDVDLKKAQDDAKKAIWKKYLSQLDQSQIDQYLLLQDEIDKSIDDFILNFYIKESKIDSKAKTITLLVRAEVNEALLNGKLKNQSAAGQTSSQEGSNIGFLIIPRKEVNRKQYKDKEIDVVEESESVSSSMVEDENSESESKSSMKKNSQGGSEDIKADISKYEKTNQTISTEDIDPGFLSVLSPFGFEVTKYSMIEGYCEGVAQSELEKEFIQNGKISNKNKIKVFKAAKDCDMNYFVSGVMTIQKTGREPDTKNTVANVSLSVEITSIPKKGPPKTVAAFVEQVSEVGSTERSAAIKAAKLVSEITAKKIVDQLNSKGIN